MFRKARYKPTAPMIATWLAARSSPRMATSCASSFTCLVLYNVRPRKIGRATSVMIHDSILELLTNSEDGLKVKITLKDGRVLEHTTGRADILGSQKNPWGFDNIKAKFEENVALVLNDDDVNRAVRAWSDIPEVTNVAELVRSTLVATKA